MSKCVEITLVQDAFQPTLESIRALALDVPLKSQATLAEVNRLLALFDGDFARTGTIKIDEATSATILRASAFLRLQLRQGALVTIPDDEVENGLDPKIQPAVLQAAVACYEFLSSVQTILLDNLYIPASHSGFANRTFTDLAVMLRHLFRGGRRDSTPRNDGSWQVVVLNDSSNLMRYVVVALHHELDLSLTAAKERVHEIHEQKSSIVWRGSRAGAETRARALQSWHLSAVVRG